MKFPQDPDVIGPAESCPKGPEMFALTGRPLLTIGTIFAASVLYLYYLHFVICNMLPLILMYVCLGEIIFLFF